ncbi:MAG: DASS family sodium-coupled anion symporter [Phycisphaeraceae bacterium]|nr:MAG: DASS family sodium-coupled anion symporter [Phycisphaeraceae bacterium]
MRARQAIIVTVALIGAALAYFLLPEQVDELGRRAAAIFVLAAVGWGTKIIPLFATSLFVVVASVLLLAEQGGFATYGGISATKFIEPFGSNIIMLFLGGLVLSVAMSEYNLDKTIATRFLAPFTDRPLILIYAVACVTAFFSMWMSNTATAAMMLAIVGSLLRNVPKNDRFGTGLIIAVAMGANIGGIGTPIGSPPNAIAVAALRTAGYEITFLSWMIMAIPLAIVLLTITGLVIYWLFPPTENTAVTDGFGGTRMTRESWITLGVLVGAVVAWLTGGIHGISDGVIALSAVVVLAATGLINTEHIKKVDWSVLILIWGGLTLGRALEATGLIAQLGEIPLEIMPGFILAFAVLSVAVILSSFISNTATAALLIPIVLSFGLPNEAVLVVLTALACSFAMAMPVSTPPNALAISSERLQVFDLFRVGGRLSVGAVLVVLVGYWLVIPKTLGL